ncbi:PTS glucose transporter subunit IIA [Mycoplasma suis]|uniref:Phosphoenolpyruvate-dependent sugar phosphotransferase system, EIIA component n=2 Tax=Mycoplasma suis TaxID=57372 RepID=F0QPZ1_MYCSL|nr:PTS glucose transporter subunit IIA [Mycoplasma suis]ADX97561.1 phosphoenolpyruvate-dependent sugar phosphotransferase system, EIIA component [Mycoplasma suis str. Illinois]CBZ40105.1 Phosphotransferase system protein, sugar-specific permease EIIA 1 domain [Mycoplasma suis KI3806]
MFGFFKKKKVDDESNVINVYSPIDGFVVSQKKIPDEGFSEGYMGLGVGLRPRTFQTGEEKKLEVVAPLGGKLEVVFKTGHAYIIRENKHNLAVMLHLGINTVEISQDKGAFVTELKQGQDINELEPLCTMNLDVIHEIMKTEREKPASPEEDMEGKKTSDVSALLVQSENLEGKTVVPVKKDGEPVSKGEVILKIIPEK